MKLKQQPAEMKEGLATVSLQVTISTVGLA